MMHVQGQTYTRMHVSVQSLLENVIIFFHMMCNSVYISVYAYLCVHTYVNCAQELY